MSYNYDSHQWKGREPNIYTPSTQSQGTEAQATKTMVLSSV
jgi:hypothetical protein